jgi:hypothetical protein
LARRQPKPAGRREVFGECKFRVLSPRQVAHACIGLRICADCAQCIGSCFRTKLRRTRPSRVPSPCRYTCWDSQDKEDDHASEEASFDQVSDSCGDCRQRSVGACSRHTS